VRIGSYKGGETLEKFTTEKTFKSGEHKQITNCNMPEYFKI
jgi:hypothetical protein